MKLRLFIAGTAIAAAVLISGCAPHTQTVTPQAPPPGEFAWYNQTLTASGTGSARSTAAMEPQRSLAAKQAAKTAAIADLKQRVRDLEIGRDMRLGALMDDNIGLKRAVEQHLQSARVTSEQALEAGRYQVDVELSLQPLSGTLKRNHITPDELPEAPEREVSDVPPVT